jgi:hypothetical protein
MDLAHERAHSPGGHDLRPRHRPRLFTTATLVALCGAITGLAAAGGVGPFASLGVTTQHTVAAQLPGAPLRADSLYPAPTQPAPTHELILVTDPPARYSTAASTPWPETEAPATAAPTSRPSPTPDPCDDDCGGGGDH